MYAFDRVLRDNAMFEKSNQNKNETQLRASVKQQARWIIDKKALERDRLEAHAKLFEDHRKAKVRVIFSRGTCFNW